MSGPSACQVRTEGLRDSSHCCTNKKQRGLPGSSVDSIHPSPHPAAWMLQMRAAQPRLLNFHPHDFDFTSSQPTPPIHLLLFQHRGPFNPFSPGHCFPLALACLFDPPNHTSPLPLLQLSFLFLLSSICLTYSCDHGGTSSALRIVSSRQPSEEEEDYSDGEITRPRLPGFRTDARASSQNHR